MKLWSCISTIIFLFALIFVSIIWNRLPISNDSSLTPTLAPRPFNTTDLFITPDMLPPGWDFRYTPDRIPCHVLSYINCLRAYNFDIRRQDSRITQNVARFETVQAAASAYNQHHFTRDTQGKYASTWEPISGFSYSSQIADQYRVVCETAKNRIKVVESCILEAQYDEFLFTIFYSLSDPNRALSNIEMIASALDEQMERYLKYKVAVATGSLRPTLPPRPFDTANLLINPSLLPTGWRYVLYPRKFLCHSNEYDHCLDIRSTTFSIQESSDNHKLIRSFDHTVIRFESIDDAKNGYNEHKDVPDEYIKERNGELVPIWQPMANFTYTSPIADEFRVSCRIPAVNPAGGIDCAIEAQYEEFLSIVKYGTDEINLALSDMETIAKAIDIQMSKHLK